MALPVSWTKKANTQLYKTTSWLAENWPDAVVVEYVDAVFKATQLIGEFPEMGQKTAKARDLRSYLIKPYTRLVYRIKPGKVVILRLIDTRQRS